MTLFHAMIVTATMQCQAIAVCEGESCDVLPTEQCAMGLDECLGSSVYAWQDDAWMYEDTLGCATSGLIAVSSSELFRYTQPIEAK